MVSTLLATDFLPVALLTLLVAWAIVAFQFPDGKKRYVIPAIAGAIALLYIAVVPGRPNVAPKTNRVVLSYASILYPIPDNFDVAPFVAIGEASEIEYDGGVSDRGYDRRTPNRVSGRAWFWKEQQGMVLYIYDERGDLYSRIVNPSRVLVTKVDD